MLVKIKLMGAESTIAVKSFSCGRKNAKFGLKKLEGK
jgi:hypothetical protein